MNSTELALLDDVASLQDKQLEWTCDVIRIPTVNPYSGDDSAGSEAEGQDWVESRMKELGADTRRVPVPADVYVRGGVIGPPGRSWDNRDNVIGEWQLGDGAGPTIVINDHMDTVGTAGMEIDPFDPLIKDGKLLGRGSSDTKGNLVLGLIAVEALLKHAEGLSGRIVFESVVDEECNGGGAGSLACCLAGVTGDFVICLDGSTMQLINGCNGVVTARVRVRGEAGHSSAGRSVSAIDKGIVAKQAIDRFGEAHAARNASCMVNLGIFRSGTLPAIVPGEAELQLNATYPLDYAEEAEKAYGRWDGRLFRAEFEQAMGALHETDEWFTVKPAEVSWIKDLPPYFSDPDNKFIRTAAAATADVEGRTIPVHPMPAWFDGAHLARRLKVPVLSMGRGTPGTAHTAHEYVLVDDLLNGAKAVALTLFRLLTP